MKLLRPAELLKITIIQFRLAWGIWTVKTLTQALKLKSDGHLYLLTKAFSCVGSKSLSVPYRKRSRANDLYLKNLIIDLRHSLHLFKADKITITVGMSFVLGQQNDSIQVLGDVRDKAWLGLLSSLVKTLKIFTKVDKCKTIETQKSIK